MGEIVGFWSRGENTDRRDEKRAAFLEDVRAVLSARTDVHDFDVDDAEFVAVLHTGDGSPLFNLAGLQSDVKDMPPEQRRLRIDEFFSKMLARPALPGSPEEAKAIAFPFIRPCTFLGYELLVSEDDAKMARPFLPFIERGVGLAYNGMYGYFSQSHARGWGLGFDELWAAAIENLRRDTRDGDTESYDPEAPYPIFYLQTGDAAESARLLLPGFLESFTGRVKGAPIAVIPRRDLLVISGDGDERAVERLIELASLEWQDSARRVSADVYTLGRSELVPLELRAGSPLYKKLQRNRVMMAAHEYAAQSESLQALASRDRDFAARYPGFWAGGFMVDDPERPHYVATWSVEQDVYLPRSEVLLLSALDRVRGGDEVWIVSVSWSRALEVLGALQPVEGVDPARYFAPSPDRATFEKLIARCERTLENEDPETALASYQPNGIDLDGAKFGVALSLTGSRQGDDLGQVFGEFVGGIVLGWAIESSLCGDELLADYAPAVVSFSTRQLPPNELYRALGAHGSMMIQASPQVAAFLGTLDNGVLQRELDACLLEFKEPWAVYDAMKARLDGRFSVFSSTRFAE